MLVRRPCEEQPERSLISLSGWTSSRRSGGSRAVSALEPRAARSARPHEAQLSAAVAGWGSRELAAELS